MKYPIGTPTTCFILLLLLTFSACTDDVDYGTTAAEPADEMEGVMIGPDSPLGVQLWSFRHEAEKDPAGTFAMARDMGLTHVESAGFYGMTADSFAQAVEDAGLDITSMHVSYDDLKNNMDQVIADAKAIGVTYVGTAWYPHESGNFDEATARRAIADFNDFGASLKEAGLMFFYHNHGYEPSPYEDGTLLDLIIDETDPELVTFEMDVLWTWLPNIDPIALMQRHPGRFKLMHIKDMKPGIERGDLSGGLPNEQKAVIGEGQVDWPALLEAAEEHGFEHYYLEDETTDPVSNAPKSIAYLKSISN